ncbi:MAG: hypothetical protein GTN38_03830 [Candidatus Aenigmarchaeota archaeon]|nr:hypothetical protein [Candidatus Aenigmarchaeota archaeon]NIP40792.1 hypothetical protein [Candidatus Aenigmarchaeota archaeon]NIQ17906.1 hypothetical protein [Candidatus Aenigmarchaeota archaeon]NIS73495.1 hypothetical protein [Candidatus Aenigmarchaeota archaeon]
MPRGRTYRLNLNTTAVIKGLNESFGEKFNPQYHPRSRENYDTGVIKDHETKESLVIVGEPKEELSGDRQLKLLVSGPEADESIGKFIDICQARKVGVYPF